MRRAPPRRASPARPPARSADGPRAELDAERAAAAPRSTASASSRCSVPIAVVAERAGLLVGAHDHRARLAREPLEHQRPLPIRRRVPCFLWTACRLTPSTSAICCQLQPCSRALRDLQRLERLEQPAERGDRGQPDGRVAAGGGVGELGRLVHGCQPTLTNATLSTEVDGRRRSRYPAALVTATRSSAETSRPPGAATTPAAVDAHLRHVADEFEALGRCAADRPPPPVARRGRLDAGAGDPRGGRGERPAASRGGAARRERARRARRGRGRSSCVGKLERLQAELDRLLAGLQSTAETLTARSTRSPRDVGGDARRQVRGAPAGTVRPPVTARPLAADARAQRSGRRGRRPAGRAQHGARGRPARRGGPLPGRALRGSPDLEALLDAVYTSAGRDRRAARADRAARARGGARRSRRHPGAAVLGPEHDDAAARRGRPRRPLGHAGDDRARAADRPGARPAARRARAVGRGARGSRRRRRPARAGDAARLREGGARPDEPGGGDEPCRRARPGRLAGGARGGGLLPLPRRAGASRSSCATATSRASPASSIPTTSCSTTSSPA